MKYLKIAAIAAAYLLFGVKTDVFGQTACPVPSVSVTCSPLLCSPDSVLLTAPSGYATVGTFAGADYGNLDGMGRAANFNNPNGIAADAQGNLYIADQMNNALRKISPNGQVSTLVGNPTSYALSAGLFHPSAIALDAAGNLYVSDAYPIIHKITPQGAVSVFAGSNAAGYSDDTGTAAKFGGTITGIAVDLQGNLFVTDASNYLIRKITPQGVVSTVAGRPGVFGHANGTGNAATFKGSSGIALLPNGDLVVSEYLNHDVRRVTQAGVVTTVAGDSSISGSPDGPAATAGFAGLLGITTDSAGNIYVVDVCRVRVISTTGTVSTLAGNFNSGYRDSTGSNAYFTRLQGICSGPSGTLFCTESSNLVRKISAAALVSTFAGSVYSNQTNGPTAAATFNYPISATADGAGNLYIADAGNNNIRKISPQGIVTTLAGSVNGGGNAYINGQGTSARFNYPIALVADTARNLYVADLYNNVIRKITPSGLVSTFAGVRSDTGGYADGPGTAARFRQPNGIAIDRAGNLYVTERSNPCIRKITASGIVSTFAGSLRSGSNDGLAAAASFNSNRCIALAPDGNLYVSDLRSIRRISPAGLVSTLGNGGTGNYDNDCFPTLGGQYIQFTTAGDMLVAGGLFLGRTVQYGVFKITPSGSFSTLAGGGPGNANGTDTAAGFYRPTGIAVTGTNRLAVTDAIGRNIRSINLTDANAYLWSNGATAKAIKVSETGNYSVRAVYGTCTTAASANVAVNVLRPATPQISQVSDSLIAQPYAPAYRWYLNDTLLPDSGQEISIQNISYGYFKVQSVSAEGCLSPLSEAYPILGLTGGIPVPELSLLPNPAGSYVRVAGLSAPATLRITDLQGRSVINTIAATDTPIDISGLAAGMYQVQIMPQGQNKTGNNSGPTVLRLVKCE